MFTKYIKLVIITTISVAGVIVCLALINKQYYNNLLNSNNQKEIINTSPALSKIISDTEMYRQKADNTCGIASLAFILSHLGFNIQEEQLVTHTQIPKEGANLLILSNFTMNFGFQAYGRRSNYAALEKMFKPLIVHINGNHFMVLLEADKHKTICYDPSDGEYILFRRLDFLMIWDGIVLQILPSSIYVKRNK